MNWQKVLEQGIAFFFSILFVYFLVMLFGEYKDMQAERIQVYKEEVRERLGRLSDQHEKILGDLNDKDVRARYRKP